jgi:hypothetical protein
MFPKRPGSGARQQRSVGKKKPAASFRIPDHLLKRVLDAEAKGYTRTHVILQMMEVASDIADALGPDWWEIEKRAAQEGTSPGVVLAHLAVAALEAEKKTKR